MSVHEAQREDANQLEPGVHSHRKATDGPNGEDQYCEINE